MKTHVLSLLLAALIALWLIPVASAQTGGSAPEEWNYTLDEEAGTVTLTKYIGSADSVTVPASFDVEGREYGTVLASQTVFRANTGLKAVTIGAGVRFLNNSMRLLFGECTALTDVDLSAVDTSGVVRMDYMFYNCTALKSVALSALKTGAVTTLRGFFSGCTSLNAADFSSFDTSEVTDLSYLFYDCSALQTVELSAFDTGSVTAIRAMFSGCTRLSGLTGYENWDTSSLENMSFAFNKFVQSVSASVHVKIDLSRWDLSHLNNSAWCFQNCRAQEILLPDNLSMMSAGFLNHATRYEGTSFTVPSGVKKIGYAHTLYDFATNDLTEIRVAEGNTNYKAVDGVLYSADGKEMLAVPRNKPFENGVFEIPEGVDFLGELSFSRNYNIHTVVLPDSYEIEYVPLYADRYIVYEDTGNLNAGTNLSIAIYCYTGITDYAVKDTNPRYASADGIIYSKDMQHIVAVPARYNKAMQIPEGVTAWDREAMWADGSSTVDNLLANCSGVTIPSTLKTIADDQFAMLNRLYTNRKGTSNPFTITVAEGNTAFFLDENGALCRSFTVTWQNWNGEVLKSETLTEGATPAYDGATPTRPEDNAFTYTFSGWSSGSSSYAPSAALPAVKGNVIYTATFSKTEQTAQKDWMSVRIEDRIYIKYLLHARENLESVTIEYLGQDGVEVPQGTSYAGNQLTFDDSGMCEILAVVAPAQIGDTVRVTILANGATTEYEYSVARYCKYLIDGDYEENVQKLAKATLEYGQAANDYFAGMEFYHPSQITTIEDAVKAEKIAEAQGLTNHLSTQTNGILSGVSFMALAQPEFRFYVSPDCALTEADFAALNGKIRITDAEGEEARGVDAQFVRNTDTDTIFLEVTGIEAADMDEVVTIGIDGFGTIEFCGNDFARMLALNESTRTLGTALYLYSTAADACFNGES